MGKHNKNTKQKEQVTSMREDLEGGEQSGPKKQSQLLDCTQKIMLEISVTGAVELDYVAILLTKLSKRT